MSGGEKAADETKGAFQAVSDMGEDLRKNVNSFADNLLGGNKCSHSSSGGTGDVHPDAKKAGDELKAGVDSAGKKIDQAWGEHQRKSH